IPILIEKNKAQLYLDMALTALDMKITKTELRTGEFKPKTWTMAYEKGCQDFLRDLGRFKRDPLWEVIIDVARR
ncbi:MAG: hypothetical protein GX892_01470, partial [Thermoanaerobacteraceae bacterium]|nr:hypothetical protein [Thermoanaerobacteraceae bacterium]